MRSTSAFFLIIALFFSLGLGMLDHVVDGPQLPDSIMAQEKEGAEQGGGAALRHAAKPNLDSGHDKDGCEDSGASHTHLSCHDHHHHAIADAHSPSPLAMMAPLIKSDYFTRLAPVMTLPAFRPPIA